MKITKVIIQHPFTGYPKELILENGALSFSPLSVEEYLAVNPSCEVVTFERYHEMHGAFYLKPFIEITEDVYDEALNCLPPMRWHTIGGRWSVFYISEATSGNIHNLYVRDKKEGKYYCGTKRITQKDDEILADIKKEILGDG